jgi:amino acid adenylation domain-containing protein
VLSEQLDYWRRQLGGALPVLELPADRPRPAMQTLRGATQSLALRAPLAESLKELSRREGVTLFMTMLAAFDVLLSRYSGQTDIVVGTATASRNRAEIEGLIGFFINTLAMRTDLSGDPTFRQLLTRVRQVALGAYAHQDVPFEYLVEKLQPERDLSHSPVFQVNLVLQNGPLPSPNLAGLRISTVEVETDVSKFDLTLMIEESGRGLTCSLEYNTDLFDNSSITRMLKHFDVLLNGIIADPGKRISDLPLLTEAENDRMLREWNDTGADYSKGRCVHELFEQRVAARPDKTALEFGTEKLTYLELNERSNQLAHHLRLGGVREESLVGILMDRSLEMVIAILGVLKAGGAYLPLDPSYPEERLAFMLEDAKVQLLLTQQHFVERLPAHSAETIFVDSQWAELSSNNRENLSSHVTSQNLCYVIYTSGSTGRPKGVAIQHEGVCNMSEAQKRVFRVTSQSRILQFSTFGFDASVWEIFMALLNGATLCLESRQSLLPGPNLTRFLRDRAITIVTLPPSALSMMAAESVPSLQTLIVAGEACPANLVARWQHGRQFINAYGPTESTVCATIAECHDDGRQPAIGRPISNAQVYLLDGYLRPVPIMVAGELYIGGVGLARGYLNRPDLTAERFIPNPFSGETGTRLYRTGDLARYRMDGTIEYLGRIDNQVKVRGYRIELGEIEAVLREHGAVADVVVTIRANTHDDKRLVAYVVPNEPSGDWPLLAARNYLRERLPEYMIPSSFVLMEALPLTPNGKIDHSALPAPHQVKSDTEVEYVAPRTALEEGMAEIWKDLLDVELVSPGDNFFDLGGHSLLMTKLVSRIPEVMGVEIPMRSLFEFPTLEGMSKLVNDSLLEQEDSGEMAKLLEELKRLSPAEARLMLEAENQLAASKESR